MNRASLVIVRWADERARAAARAVGNELERAGLMAQLGGRDWFCMSDSRAEPFDRDMHLFGEVHGTIGGDLATSSHARCPSWWGRFVIVDASRTGPTIRSEGSGSWPLWSLCTDSLTIVADHLSPQLARSAGERPAPSFIGLASVLVDAACVTHVSLLSGVERVPPGAVFSLRDRSNIGSWLPGDVARRRGDASASVLREAVDAAVMASSGRATSVQLSGGLDRAHLGRRQG